MYSWYLSVCVLSSDRILLGTKRNYSIQLHGIGTKDQGKFGNSYHIEVGRGGGGGVERGGNYRDETIKFLFVFPR